MRWNEEGASELLDETLILAMGLVLAVAIMMLVTGVIPFTEKTAYLVPRFGIGNISGQTVITIFDRGGEPVYFNGSPAAKYRADLYVDTQSGSYKAVPSPALTAFTPGDTIYIYYTGSGFVLTNTLSGTAFPSLPAGKLVVRFVDATSGVLIAKEELVQGPVTPTPVFPPVTTTAVTTTTPTPAQTTASLAANFTWSESGNSGNVRFTDTSTGSPTTRVWAFGDGETATTPNPIHKFTKGSSHDVTLTITRSPDGATSMIIRTVTV